MKKLVVLIISLLGFVVIVLGAFLLVSKIYLSPVGTSNEKVEIVVESGSTINDIANILKEKNLIKSKKMFLIYVKLNNVSNIYAAKYYLSEDMSVSEIVKVLLDGGLNTSEISITFREGLNMRKVASLISEETNNSYEDVFALLEDETYIDSLIDKYWFLTDDIKNKDIYYPLEGYLYPETYRFASKDVDVKEIFSKMLEEMGNVLSKYERVIEKSDYSIHEILTLSSIVELEGKYENDRSKVAGVFYNRLKSNWTLGSDVTGYYGAKMDDWTNGLGTHINDCNGYNTRGSCVKGLPVGPIANASLSSIKAVINPASHKYYYFVADCNGKTYFNKNESGHVSTVNRLKKEGAWCDK